MSPLYYALLLFFLTSIYVELDAHGNLSLTETAAANSSVLYRVEIELLRLENPNGISEDGLACDPLSLGCNTKVSAYLDTSALLHWPGSRDITPEDLIFEAVEPAITSMNVNTKITSQVCTSSFQSLNLRVEVKDEDKLVVSRTARCFTNFVWRCWKQRLFGRLFRGQDDIISAFNCLYGHPPAQSEQLSTWSNITFCQQVIMQPSISLSFRARAFREAGDVPCTSE